MGRRRRRGCCVDTPGPWTRCRDQGGAARGTVGIVLRDDDSRRTRIPSYECFVAGIYIWLKMVQEHRRSREGVYFRPYWSVETVN